MEIGEMDFMFEEALRETQKRVWDKPRPLVSKHGKFSQNINGVVKANNTFSTCSFKTLSKFSKVGCYVFKKRLQQNLPYGYDKPMNYTIY